MFIKHRHREVAILVAISTTFKIYLGLMYIVHGIYFRFVFELNFQRILLRKRKLNSWSIFGYCLMVWLILWKRPGRLFFQLEKHWKCWSLTSLLRLKKLKNSLKWNRWRNHKPPSCVRPKFTPIWLWTKSSQFQAAPIFYKLISVSDETSSTLWKWTGIATSSFHMFLVITRNKLISIGTASGNMNVFVPR